MWQSSIRIATVLTCTLAAGAAGAQHRPGGPGGAIGGGVPHAAPAAPRFSAPAAPAAPHFAPPAAPRFSAPAAPHFSAPPAAPRIAPQITAPHVAPHVAPHMAVPRVAPQLGVPHTPPQIARPAPPAPRPGPSLRQVPPRNLATPIQPGRDFARQLRERGPGWARVAPGITRPMQPGRTFQAAGLGPGGQVGHGATRALRNQFFAGRVGGVSARTGLAHATFRGSFAGHHWQHWRHWRRHRFFPVVIGWVGPLFWPFAYNDFVDYTFYPYAYDTFWPYAYDDLYEGMFGRYAYGYGGTYAAVGQPPGSADARSVGADLCSGRAAGLTDWPLERIAQTIEPTEAQRAALDALRDATAQALDILKASCPSALPSTPTGRIMTMHDRLAAMLQAVRTVRPALENLYRSLSDEQKARFNTLDPEDADQQPARGDLSQVCNERASGVASLPFERIERAVRLDDRQRGALEALRDATAQAVNLLQADCPTDRPLTPVARLEVMEQRLDAMLRAVEIVQPALADFYSALSDEQKERFNRLSPTQG